jgi:hypothetical protein
MDIKRTAFNGLSQADHERDIFLMVTSVVQLGDFVVNGNNLVEVLLCCSVILHSLVSYKFLTWD